MLGVWLFQISILLLCLVTAAFFLGEYMARVFRGKKTILSPVLVPVENFVYRTFQVNPQEEMNWREFILNFLLFIFLGLVTLVFLQRFQYLLPLNPEHLPAINWGQVLNAAISFVTNTNWQFQQPETSISYLTRILGLGVQNFLSAAVNITIGVVVINGFLRKNDEGLGNFWVYLTRSILYILLPLSLLLALFLMLQGTPNNLKPYVHVKTLEGKEQIIAQGPVASQVAIKQLGSNGGGVFAANAAHPYENPTPLTDWISVLAMLLIAAAFPFMFGAMARDRSKGWAIFIAMTLLFLLMLSLSSWAELHSLPMFDNLNIADGISMEGKELRFGNIATAVFATTATATSSGSTNSFFASLMPLTGMVLVVNMALGGIIFGGVGTGFINMMFYVILTMFLIALMIGRTPEIYGKKLGVREMIITVIALFIPGALQLILSAIAIYLDPVVAAASGGSNHGLTEIFYNYTSTIKNNGSSFDILRAPNLFYSFSTSLAMLVGYLLTAISALTLAGFMVKKNISPKLTHFSTTNVSFVLLLVSVVLVIGSLSFLPILALGPVVEHLKMLGGGF